MSGGPTRKSSVKNGLAQLTDDVEFVVIHDGVRPFIQEKIITATITAAKHSGAAVAGVPLKQTVKKIELKNLEVDVTLNRNEIWEIQTPQVFAKQLIMRAYEHVEHNEAPDDAFLVERLGHRVALVMGSYFNIKITTPEDMVLAHAIHNYFQKHNT